MEGNLDKRYQTLVILWFALLMSIGMRIQLQAASYKSRNITG
jgi:hypothetical protein